MSRQWRSAVIGTGTVGDWHVACLGKLTNTKLIAVCDVDGAKAQRAVEKHKFTGIPVYTDLHEMLRKEPIDVVHVCTPSGNHLDPAIAAMKAGKNVIVEKPMEILPNRVDQMLEAAEKHNVKLAGIFQNRWNQANRAIYDAVQEGRFGRVAFVGGSTPWYRTDAYYADGGWRGTWKLDGGGAVMNQGVHQVDLIQWIGGPIKTVSAHAASRIHAAIEVEDTLTCSLQYASGAFGTFMSSTAMWPGGNVRLEVGGEFGTAVSERGLTRFDFKDPRPEDKELVQRLDPNRASDPGGGGSNTTVVLDLHGLNLLSIYTAWENGQEAETSGREARKAVAIIKAMYDSARQNGKPIDIK